MADLLLVEESLALASNFMDNNQKTASPNQKQIEILTSPVSVPATQDPDAETAAQRFERNGKFINLPIAIKARLSSSETSQRIQLIGQKYGFELLRLANITRLIREYYFGEVRFENFPSEIEKRMGVSLLTAQEITRYIKSEIIDWDPWAEYLAKLPKMPIREIAQRYPKIASMEITKGYIELKNSDGLENPTIKNWLKDFVSHLGYEKHSQMQRTEYLFHSENGKDLDSLDREKLSIILKSFDENVPLPMDEENGEIVFDGLVNESASSADRQRTVNNSPMPADVPKSQPTPIRQDSFIKPYSPIQQPQKQAPRPAPAPVRNTPSQNFIKPVLVSRPKPTSTQPSPLQTGGQAYKGEGVRPDTARAFPTQNFMKPNPVPSPQSIANVPDNFASQTGKEELNKYFSATESLEIPEIKIHSITEHNETPSRIPPRAGSEAGRQIAHPQTRPQAVVQRPTLPQPNIQRPVPHQETRPQHRMIEPRLDGNIVDLSEQ